MGNLHKKEMVSHCDVFVFAQSVISVGDDDKLLKGK